MRLCPSEPEPAVDDTSHRRWLRELSQTRLEATTANLAQTLRRTTADLARLPIRWRRQVDSIAAVEVLGSETHNGGQRPVLVRFSSDQAVVYKPVNLRIDQRVSKCLTGMGARSGMRDLFKSLHYVPAGTEYGFIEHVGSQSRLRDQDAARRYFFRFGALVATAYALNITDMHMENVFAVGEFPLLIDLETSLYRFPDSIRPSDVTLSGLIQARVGGTHRHSGLQGGGPCQRWGLTCRTEGEQMVVGYRQSWYHAANRPLGPRNELIDPTHFRTSLLAGFDAGYRLVEKERRWLGEQIELDPPGSMRVRHILRFTSYYTLQQYRLLQASPQPMKRRLKELQRQLSAGEIADRPGEADVVTRELTDLLCGDVPYFWTHHDSCSLNNHQGLVKSGFLPSSPLAGFHEQLARLSVSDRRAQREILQAALN